jgi:hypothetical protein
MTSFYNEKSFIQIQVQSKRIKLQRIMILGSIKSIQM